MQEEEVCGNSRLVTAALRFAGDQSLYWLLT